MMKLLDWLVKTWHHWILGNLNVFQQHIEENHVPLVKVVSVSVENHWFTFLRSFRYSFHLEQPKLDVTIAPKIGFQLYQGPFYLLSPTVGTFNFLKGHPPTGTWPRHQIIGWTEMMNQSNDFAVDSVWIDTGRPGELKYIEWTNFTAVRIVSVLLTDNDPIDYHMPLIWVEVLSRNTHPTIPLR